MKRVFVDTGYYAALVNPRDAWHSKALDFSRTYHGTTLATEYVLTELGSLLARRELREHFVALVNVLNADPFSTVLPAAAAVFEAGLNLFAARSDKEWSLTDCMSFEVMRNEGLTDALATDHHFQQAGFRVVLKDY